MVAMAIPQTRNIRLPLMNLIRIKGIPILQQLHLEEQLLRTSSDNWCIINDGTNNPTIVMGISGKPAELLEVDLVLRDQIPVIRRFSGGGTVTVDHGTIFVTFIGNKDAVAGLQPYPQPIMSWSSLLYSSVSRMWFSPSRKCLVGMLNLLLKPGGSTTHPFYGTMRLRTWHSSNLRAPEYRSARDHLEFICCMKHYMPRSVFLDKTVEAIKTQFSVKYEESDVFETTSNTKFVPSTRLLTRQELEEAAFGSQVESTLSQSLSL